MAELGRMVKALQEANLSVVGSVVAQSGAGGGAQNGQMGSFESCGIGGGAATGRGERLESSSAAAGQNILSSWSSLAVTPRDDDDGRAMIGGGAQSLSSIAPSPSLPPRSEDS